MNTYKLLFCLFVVLRGVQSIVDPLSMIALTSVVGIATYFLKNQETREQTVKYASKFANKACQLIGYCEGCEDYWIPANLKGLEFELKSEVFGQSIAVEMILSALKSHLKSTNPRRSLVLSFQGSPGTGKNFVSKKILKNMFLKGDKTKYTHFFRSSIDFPLKKDVEEYKEHIIKTIMNMVYECHRSVFVFDEVEKMPNGILDVVSSFVQAERYGDYDFRRVIFILLSNIGSEVLNQEALNTWKQGIKREDMSTKELSRLLATESYNNEGGLKGTKLVKNHDVSFFVPFLPLDRFHIIQCLEHYVVTVKRQIMSPELTELVLEEMPFFPEPQKIFSTSGCKRVAEVADFLIERQTAKKRRKSSSLI